jgi:hypothetical protein
MKEHVLCSSKACMNRRSKYEKRTNAAHDHGPHAEQIP